MATNKVEGTTTTQQFKFVDGSSLDFEEFDIKTENLRRIHVYLGDEMESCWAAFSDEGMQLLQSCSNPTEKYNAVCILQNALVVFFPHNSWGLYVPLKIVPGKMPFVQLKDVSEETDIHLCKEAKMLLAKMEKKQKSQKEEQECQGKIEKYHS
jgi:hypothetical protein